MRGRVVIEMVATRVNAIAERSIGGRVRAGDDGNSIGRRIGLIADTVHFEVTGRG